MARLTTAHCYHLAIASALAIFPAPALAHSWYDGACCLELHCSRYLEQVEERRDGYWLPDFNVLIPYSDPKVRQSRDFDFHVCIFHDEAGPHVRCLYVPGRGT